MKINSLEAETNAVIRVAEDMAAAARTAPKTRGIDHIETLIVTGDDLKELADAMKRYGEQTGQAFFVRDSKNIENSKAVLFIASGHHVRGLNETCALCGAANCAEASKEKKNCVYDPIDLGIALGSAVVLPLPLILTTASCSPQEWEQSLSDGSMSPCPWYLQYR